MSSSSVMSVLLECVLWRFHKWSGIGMMTGHPTVDYQWEYLSFRVTLIATWRHLKNGLLMSFLIFMFGFTATTYQKKSG